MKPLAHSKRNLGGSDPVSTFGRQNRTNTGVAPAQIEVFVRGLFTERISAVCSSEWLCGQAWVNGTAIFSSEHCLCSCVHPYWRSAEREGYLSTRTLPAFQCSAGLNEVRGPGTNGYQNRSLGRCAPFSNPRFRRPTKKRSALSNITYCDVHEQQVHRHAGDRRKPSMMCDTVRYADRKAHS